jgi:hypothetical protein
MKNRIIVSLCFFGFLMQTSSAQIQDYSNKRKLDASTAMWHRIKIPQDMYGKFSSDFSDVRVYGVGKKQDTIQVPYIVNSSARKVSESQIPFEIINKSSKDGVYYYTLSLNALKIANHIHLDFGNPNFEYKVDLEGSSDNNEWYSVLKDYRLLSIKNSITNYTFSDLYFPDAQYTYYRIAINSKKDPKLIKAEISINSEETGDYYTTEVSSFQDSSVGNQSIYYFSTSNKLIVSHLKVFTADTLDYYRHFTLDIIINDTNQKVPNINNAKQIASGYLSSLGQNSFTAKQAIGQYYRLTIDNQDNEAISISKIDLFSLEHTLTVRFTQPADYYLVYGNVNASAPNYDISYFKDRLPENTTFLSLGKEEEIVKKNPLKESSPLFSNKMWLWVIIVLVIGLLGWFTLKMMQNTT